MQSDLNLRPSQMIVAVSAALLFIFMFFFPWFEIGNKITTTINGHSYTTTYPSAAHYSANLWHWLDLIRWVVLLTVLAALAMVAVAATGARPPVPLSPIVAGLAGLSVVLILFRAVVSKPGTHHGVVSFGAFGASVSPDVTTKVGAYLGFL